MADACYFRRTSDVQTDVVLVAARAKKWAVLTLTHDEVGTATTLPVGTGCGLSYGSLGRVGSVMATCEFAGSFDVVEDSPVASGANAGSLDATARACTVSGTRGAADGDYEALGTSALPRALRAYMDKLVGMEPAFRDVAIKYT